VADFESISRKSNFSAAGAEAVWDETRAKEFGDWYVSRGMLPASFAENDCILLWWLPEYDDLLRQAVDEYQWAWPSRFRRQLDVMVPETVLSIWRSTDPLCVETPWHKVLSNFIGGRATQLGVRPRLPRRVECGCCSHVFWEWDTEVDRLSVNEIDICRTCFGQALRGFKGSPTATPEAVTAVLQALSAALGRPPKRGDLSGSLDFKALTAGARSGVVQALRVKPTASRVEELFGSWQAAVTHASTAPATPLPQYEPPARVPVPPVGTEFTSTDPARYLSAIGPVPDITVDLRRGDWAHEAEIEAEIQSLIETGYLALAEAALTAIARSDEPVGFRWLRAQLYGQTARFDEARALISFEYAPELRDLRTITQGPDFYEPLASAPQGNARFVLVGGLMEYVDLRGEHGCVTGDWPAGGPSLELSENVARVHAMVGSSAWAQRAITAGHAIMSTLARAGADPRPYGHLVACRTMLYRDAVKAVTGSLPKATADAWRIGEGKSRWSYQSGAERYIFNAKAGYSCITVDMPPAVSVWGWPDRSDICLQSFVDTISTGAPDPVTIILPDVPAFRDFARRYVRGACMNKIERTQMEESHYRSGGLARSGYMLSAGFEPSLVVHPDGTEDDGTVLSGALAYLDANHTLRLSVWDVLSDPLLREVATPARAAPSPFSVPVQDRFDKVRWYAQQARFEDVAALYSPYRPGLLDAVPA
jgi:hypothetical protein